MRAGELRYNMENWVDAMINREAIPKAARQETVAEFCSKWKISESTYYYQSSDINNQKKIVKIAVSLVKKSLPEVLDKLREKAEAGDVKAMDMFLNYVAELSKNLDIKSDGKALPTPILPLDVILTDNSNNKDSEPETED